MMRSVLCALILILASAPTAEAGAWLRSKGKGFLSASVANNRSKDISSSFYLEYGLTETLTLGADVYYGVDRTFFQQGSGIVFLRFPLGPTDQTNKFAAHVGVGARYLSGRYFAAGELGLSWGRGIKLGERHGWVNLDASYNVPASNNGHPYFSNHKLENRLKIDGTIGLGVTENGKAMLQLFNTFEDGDTFTTIAPSYVYTPRGGKVSVQFSVEIPAQSEGKTSIKIGVWHEF